MFGGNDERKKMPMWRGHNVELWTKKNLTILINYFSEKTFVSLQLQRKLTKFFETKLHLISIQILLLHRNEILHFLHWSLFSFKYFIEPSMQFTQGQVYFHFNCFFPHRDLISCWMLSRRRANGFGFLFRVKKVFKRKNINWK